jgi:hypothetical protein
MSYTPHTPLSFHDVVPISADIPQVVVNSPSGNPSPFNSTPGTPVDWRQGSSSNPIGDRPVSNETQTKHQRAAFVVGLGTFVLTKFGFDQDTSQSLVLSLIAGGGTYYWLTRPHAETQYY